ncbi:MAG TPA: 5-dehydro-4-deoxy-D-glucuronate isomerase [Longimicrobiales bacterium]|nr:5-dehydro-4-deoxy-D-glucuronate isomerase [Longimicrobiales bacterium]
MRYMPGPDAIGRMNTAELRETFLIEDLFQPDAVVLHAVDLDRVIVGSAVPVKGALSLGAPEAIAAEYFTERREIGVLNIGGAGTVTVDGQKFALASRDTLYVGRGSKDVGFASDDVANPARYYLVSYPAHANHPTKRITEKEANPTELGAQETANKRTLSKYFHPDAMPTAQLVMGVTSMHTGSVWNTMPPHTHQRRTEVYLYFDLPEDAVVFHMMGSPEETRSLIVRNGQVALSPSWSIHAGCGTASYSFCWAMGGENQVFSDMQGVDMRNIK